MKCVSCGSRALVEGTIRGNDGSIAGFYPKETSLFRQLFFGGRAVRAFGCMRCHHLQLAVDFTEGDLARYQQFEGQQPNVLERLADGDESVE